MSLRVFPLDGSLLLFDRDSGTNVLLDGPETAGLRQSAPRSVQFGITNACNLACAFCSRDLAASSSWTASSAFDLLADLARAGVLEVAFGGGEPFAFRGFVDLVRRLHDETPLAVHATTNGTLLDDATIAAVRGLLGELRVSIYDDNGWRGTVARLAQAGVRFGVNLLVLPERLPLLDDLILELAGLGAADVLLLSYNGRDLERHLTAAQAAELSARVTVLHRAVPRVRVGLDVCFGERLESVPRLLRKSDCGAGRDFVVITSDRRLMPCSFHDLSVPFRDARDLLAIWRGDDRLGRASTIPGCARTPGYGLEGR